jgi:glycosyltransferase involved in cell wall biosynthesis
VRHPTAEQDREPAHGAAFPTARVAIVHDWLTGMRGGEKVLGELIGVFPHADLHTLVHVRGRVSPVIERRRILTSPLSRLPGVDRYYRHLLPVFPAAVEWFDLDRYDLVISSSHCAVKSVVVPGRARHLCYCHTPMRYAWDQFDAYFGAARVGPTASVVMKRIMDRLARWDAATAGRVDRYLANSQYVARRIARYYNRSAAVVHPPVDTEFFCPDGSPPGDGLLVVSAVVPYKRIEVAVGACARLGLPLTVVGDGPDLDRLRASAGTQVRWLGSVADDELRTEYRRARAVLLPGVEDFGIVLVEAQACGRPVVALARGGALETVVDGVTGVLVADAGVESFAAGIRRVLDGPFDEAVIRRHAERFHPSRFAAEIRAAAGALMAAPPGPEHRPGPPP